MSRTAARRTSPAPWRPPTRRAFVAMLGAAAAALAVRPRSGRRLAASRDAGGRIAEAPARPIWIGHT